VVEGLDVDLKDVEKTVIQDREKYSREIK